MAASREYLRVLIIACGLAASSIGLCSNSLGVFYTAVSEDLGVLRGTFAFHATVSLVVTAVVSLAVPRLAKRFPYKPILVLGVLLCAGSTVLMAMAKRISDFFLLGTARGIGAGLCSNVMLAMVINEWFHRHNGTAMGIVLGCGGLGSAICSPILSELIVRNGWRTAYAAMGGMILLFALPACLFPFSMTPAERGLKPYGYGEGAAPPPQTADDGKRAFSYFQPGFIMLCAFVLIPSSITAIAQHFTGYAETMGLSMTFGATLVSCSMVGNICTKLLIGCISDWLRPVKACLIMTAANICALLALLAGTRIGTVPLLAAAFVYGSVFSVGAVGTPLLTRYFFGIEHYGEAYAVVGFFMNMGSSFALPIIGYIFDLTGTYRYAFSGAICLHLIGVVLLWLISRDRKTGRA